MRSNRGFTLVELLLVFGITGILAYAAIAYSRIGSGIDSDGAARTVESNISNVAKNIFQSSKPQSYAGVCTNPRIAQELRSIVQSTKANAYCFVSSDGKSYAVDFPKNSGEGNMLFPCINGGTSAPSKTAGVVFGDAYCYTAASTFVHTQVVTVGTSTDHQFDYLWCAGNGGIPSESPVRYSRAITSCH